jgi:hypothetical protein
MNPLALELFAKAHVESRGLIEPRPMNQPCGWACGMGIQQRGINREVLRLEGRARSPACLELVMH